MIHYSRASILIHVRAIWAVVAACCGPVAAQPTFMGLGDLPSTPIASNAHAVSGDGLVVVGIGNVAFSSFNITGEAFRWTAATGMIGLGDLAGGNTESVAYDVSGDGSVVVGESSSSTGATAFRWSNADGMTPLSDLPGGITSSKAMAISMSGNVIVGTGVSGSGATEACRWVGGNDPIGLGDLPGGGPYSAAFGVSGDGSVIVGESHSSIGYQAFKWTEATGMVGLGGLVGGSGVSRAQAISASGEVVVGSANSSSGYDIAMKWSSLTGMVSLGNLPGGTMSSANAVSGDGSYIVGQIVLDSGVTAFIWDETNGMRNLGNVLTSSYGIDLTGWSLTNASGISSDGLTLVGTGRNPLGHAEAWIAHIPEPTSFILYVLFASMCFTKRWRPNYE